MGSSLMYTIILFGVCILACLILCKFLRRTIGRVICVVVVVIVFCIGAEVIDLNTLPSEVQEKITAVSESVGTTYIKTQGSDIFINVNGDWLNLSKISIVKELSSDIILEYEGREIYIGHSGIYNTVKALENSGLIK